MDWEKRLAALIAGGMPDAEAMAQVGRERAALEGPSPDPGPGLPGITRSPLENPVGRAAVNTAGYLGRTLAGMAGLDDPETRTLPARGVRAVTDFAWDRVLDPVGSIKGIPDALSAGESGLEQSVLDIAQGVPEAAGSYLSEHSAPKTGERLLNMSATLSDYADRRMEERTEYDENGEPIPMTPGQLGMHLGGYMAPYGVSMGVTAPATAAAIDAVPDFFTAASARENSLVGMAADWEPESEGGQKVRRLVEYATAPVGGIEKVADSPVLRGMVEAAPFLGVGMIPSAIEHAPEAARDIARGGRRLADYNENLGDAGHAVVPAAPRRPRPGAVETNMPGEWHSELEAKIDAGPGRARGSDWLNYLYRSEDVTPKRPDTMFPESHPVADARIEPTMENRPRGFAQNEGEWTGIEELLRGRAGDVLSKEEVLELAQRNPVRVKESVSGAADGQAVEAARRQSQDNLNEMNRLQNDAMEDLTDAGLEYWAANDIYIGLRGSTDVGGAVDHAVSLTHEGMRPQYEAFMAANAKYNEGTKALADITPTRTKFGRYTVNERGLDPAANYQEVKIQLERPDYRSQADELLERIESDHILPEGGMDDAGRKADPRWDEYYDLLDQANSKTGEYRGTHFEEPDVLGSMRLTDESVDGDRTLFNHEHQSDWAQDGRKRGFRGEGEVSWREGVKDDLAELQDRGFEVREEHGHLTYHAENPENGLEMRYVGADMARMDGDDTWEIAQRLEDAHGGAPGAGAGVPDMPFKKTNQWLGLMVRNMLQRAAAGGYDRIGWATGRQTNDLYDLRKHVSQIEYNEGTGRLRAYDVNNENHLVIDEMNVKPGDLEGHIGKDPAVALMGKDASGNGVRFIEGDDLAVGGEGMLKWADEIVTQAYAREIKKYGLEIEEARVFEGGAVRERRVGPGGAQEGFTTDDLPPGYYYEEGVNPEFGEAEFTIHNRNGDIIGEGWNVEDAIADAAKSDPAINTSPEDLGRWVEVREVGGEGKSGEFYRVDGNGEWDTQKFGTRAEAEASLKGQPGNMTVRLTPEARAAILKDGARLGYVDPAIPIGAASIGLRAGTGAAIGSDLASEEGGLSRGQGAVLGGIAGVVSPHAADVAYTALRGMGDAGHLVTPGKGRNDTFIGTLIDGTEDLGLGERTTIRELGTALENRAIEKYGRILDLEDDRGEIVRVLADEVAYAMKDAGNASEWYKEKINGAFRIWTEARPEIASSPVNLEAARAALAITSNGQDVATNAGHADTVMQEFLKTGRFPIMGWGKEAQAMKKHFATWNALADHLGEEDLIRFLDTEVNVGDIKRAGLNVSGEAVAENLYGSVIFGPKVGGGFYQNLGGNFEPVTMDRWFRRTMGRVTGDMLSKPKDTTKAQRRMESALRRRKMDVPDTPEGLLEAAQGLKREWEALARKRGHFRNKPEWAYAAERWVINGNPTVREAPSSPKERMAMRKVIRDLQDAVEESTGERFDAASIQAILWYPEKRLYERMGIAGGAQDIDYETAFRELLGGSDEGARLAGNAGDGGSAEARRFASREGTEFREGLEDAGPTLQKLRGLELQSGGTAAGGAVGASTDEEDPGRGMLAGMAIGAAASLRRAPTARAGGQGAWWSEATGRPLSEWTEMTPQQQKSQVKQVERMARDEAMGAPGVAIGNARDTTLPGMAPETSPIRVEGGNVRDENTGQFANRARVLSGDNTGHALRGPAVAGARAVVGGTIGAASTDDPQEKIVRAAIGAGMGAAGVRRSLKTAANARRMLMLWNPATHAVNVGSTAIQVGLDAAARPVAAAVDRLLLSRITGETVTGGLHLEDLSAAIGRARKKGLPEAAEILKKGASKEEMAKLDMDVEPQGLVMRLITEPVTRMLSSMDRIFWNASMGRSISEMSRVEAQRMIDRGVATEDAFDDLVLSHRKNPTDQMQILAAMEAAEAVFQDQSKLRDQVKGLRERFGKLGDIALAVFDLVIPYQSTPSNVITKGIQFSPVGFAQAGIDMNNLRRFVEDGHKALEGTMSPAVADQVQGIRGIPDHVTKKSLETDTDLQRRALQSRTATGASRAVIGTGVWYLGYLAYKNGWWTGEYPDDAQGRNEMSLTGDQTSAVKTGGGSLSLGRIGPLAIMLNGGAEMAKAEERGELGEGGDLEIMSAVGKVLDVSSGAIESSPYGDATALRGLVGGRRIDRPGINRAVADVAGSMLPSPIGAVTRNSDIVREKRSGSIIDAVSYNTPGLRGMLPARITALGDEVGGGSVLKGMAASVNPFPYRESSDDPLVLEIARVGASIGDARSTGPMREAGRGTPEYEALARRYGDAVRSALEAKILTFGYTRLEDQPTEQAELLEQAASKARSDMTRTIRNERERESRGQGR